MILPDCMQGPSEPCAGFIALQDEANRLLAELEECKRDAERYRWLRHHPPMYGAARIARSPAALDIMIDAALAAKEGSDE